MHNLMNAGTNSEGFNGHSNPHTLTQKHHLAIKKLKCYKLKFKNVFSTQVSLWKNPFFTLIFYENVQVIIKQLHKASLLSGGQEKEGSNLLSSVHKIASTFAPESPQHCPATVPGN